MKNRPGMSFHDGYQITVEQFCTESSGKACFRRFLAQLLQEKVKNLVFYNIVRSDTTSFAYRRETHFMLVTSDNYRFRAHLCKLQTLTTYYISKLFLTLDGKVVLWVGFRQQYVTSF